MTVIDTRGGAVKLDAGLRRLLVLSSTVYLGSVLLLSQLVLLLPFLVSKRLELSRQCLRSLVERLILTVKRCVVREPDLRQEGVRHRAANLCRRARARVECEGYPTSLLPALFIFYYDTLYQKIPLREVWLLEEESSEPIKNSRIPRQHITSLTRIERWRLWRLPWKTTVLQSTLPYIVLRTCTFEGTNDGSIDEGEESEVWAVYLYYFVVKYLY